MNHCDIDQSKNLQCVYEQSWLHARHVENERLWFTNIYAAIMAGALAFMSEKGLNWPLTGFLLLVSLLGFFMCHALRVAFIKHSRMTDLVLRREWHLKDYSTFYSRLGQSTDRLYKSGEVKIKVISLSDLFYLFYMFSTSACAALFLQAIGLCTLYIFLVGGGMFTALFLLFRFVFKKVEDRLHSEMGNLEKVEIHRKGGSLPHLQS